MAPRQSGGGLKASDVEWLMKHDFRYWTVERFVDGHNRKRWAVLNIFSPMLGLGLLVPSRNSDRSAIIEVD